MSTPAQRYTQKYTIACFFAAQELGTNFSALEWPLHITIIDTFKTDWPVATLIRAVQEVATATKAVDVLPVEQAFLGPDKDVPVKLIQPNEALVGLHYKLLALGPDGSFVFNTPEFVGKGFLPHATDQKDATVQLGQTYHLTTISLVDMFPSGDYMLREVLGTFTLNG
jgi:hypothetical protein